MKKTFIVTAIFAVATSGILLLNACGSGNADAENTRVQAADSVAVQTTPVIAQDIADVRTYTGTLEGELQANVVAKIAERITAINVEVGDMVQSGQTVVSLDKTGVSSQYYQARANFQNTEKNLERMKSLYDQGAISQQTLDGTQTNHDIAKANFDAAKAAVELTSPISGIVTSVDANIGDLTSPGAPIITMARISSMKLIFNASESEVQDMTIGQPVHVYSNSRPDIVINGKIIQIARSADVRSRSFQVKALFPNKNNWFKPGMFVRAEVRLSSAENSPVVPNEAILHNNQGAFVYVIRNSRAYRQSIETGITDGVVTQVIKGLQKGQDVVTTGWNNLSDSTLVVVVNQQNASLPTRNASLATSNGQ